MQRFVLTVVLFAGLTFAQNLTQIEDLPPCGQTCINNMIGKANSLGCSTADYVCLCQKSNFGNGVRDCAIPLCAAANPPVDTSNIISVAENFCSEATAAATTGSLTSAILNDTTAVSEGAVVTSTATATGSSFASATTSTPTLVSPTISPPTFPSSTTVIVNPPSTSASPSLSPSAKVGVGIGVPLCVIVLVTIVYLTRRYRKHAEISRLRHHGNVAAAGLYPAIEEGEKAREKEDEKNKVEVESSSKAQGLKRNDSIYEIQGTGVPAYLRELAGSPGVRRQELPNRRFSA